LDLSFKEKKKLKLASPSTCGLGWINELIFHLQANPVQSNLFIMG